MTKDEKAKSIVTVEFESPGSARFSANFMNVDPYQLLALASVLELEAKAMIMDSRQTEAQVTSRKASVSVPTPSIILPGTLRK